MKRVFILVALAALGACREPQHGESLDGRWQGSSFAFGDSAPLTVDFRQEEDSLRAWATMTAEAMLRDKPLENVRLDDNELHMELATHSGGRAFFLGQVRADTIEGNFVKNENAVRVRLVRTGAIPQPPYQFDSISFRSTDGTLLRGTLFVPAGTGPHPAVVLIHGSGPSVRSDFNYLADVFARHGIAAFAYDKRGAGASGGDASRATLSNFADDARAAVAALSTRPDIRQSAIGLCGVSEGGWVAPVAASDEPRVAFLIAVVAPGDGYEANALYQNTMRLRAARATDSDIEKYRSVIREIDAIVRARSARVSDASIEPRARRAQSMLDSLNGLKIFDVTDLPRFVPSGSQLEHFRWKVIDFDPVPYWKKISVPVFVLLGERDRNLDSRVSLEKIGRALREAGNPDVAFLTYAGANHDLMVPAAGSGFRFPVPAPGYPDTLAKWAAGTLSRLGQR